MLELTSYEVWQLLSYGDILPETLPGNEPNEDQVERSAYYKLSGSELQTEVISEELNQSYND